MAWTFTRRTWTRSPDAVGGVWLVSLTRAAGSCSSPAGAARSSCAGGGEAVGVAFAGEEGLDVGDFFCEGSILAIGVGGAAFVEGGDHEGSASDTDVGGASAGEGEVAFAVGADGVAIEFFRDVDLAFSGAGFDGDAFVGGADGVEGGGGDGVSGGG